MGCIIVPYLFVSKEIHNSMDKAPTSSNKTLPILIAIAGWFALTAQFYLILDNRTAPVAETILRYFGFFTILTNLLVAVCLTYLVLAPNSRLGQFFVKATTLTAITIYIVVVGLVYNAVLRFQWNPQGLQKIVDEFLHSIIPVLFLLYWMIYVPKRHLQWRLLWGWLVYPLVYCIYTLLRGTASGFYPYPFMNVTELGYPVVLRNCLYVTLLFLFFSVLFIGLGKLGGKK